MTPTTGQPDGARTDILHKPKTRWVPTTSKSPFISVRITTRPGHD